MVQITSSITYIHTRPNHNRVRCHVDVALHGYLPIFNSNQQNTEVGAPNIQCQEPSSL